ERDQLAHYHYPRSGEPGRAGVRHADREPVRYLPAGLPLAVRQQRTEAAAGPVLPLLTRNSLVGAPLCWGADWPVIDRAATRSSHVVQRDRFRHQILVEPVQDVLQPLHPVYRLAGARQL